MVNRSKQNWTIGETVKVGFVSGLKIVSIELTPGDFRPDVYHLVNRSGVKYAFTPHFGLSRVN